MASYGHHGQAHPASRHSQYAGHHQAPPVVPQNTAPAGTFAPGTKIQVGSHRVVIQKYLSEGGFAHVYLVKLPKPVDGTDLAVLKRVAVPDKEALRGMRTEVETMKRLKGHRPIVTYIDSHASEMKQGGYEVFLLMENCDGGGLIDFMNTRLQHRLTEPEILHIFSDVAEGLACMHYLKPALLHRDIKVENVLIVTRGSNKRFKLCDFGSAAIPRPAPTTIAECRAMDEDIQKHTTMQYRSPEMVDVYQKKPMDEKCDIWALGVFLYKLCYYTTPFENQGQLAILNASYDFPPHPAFSHRLKALIKWMLQGDMQNRPNIYQVVKEACLMQNREVPIHNIYSGRSPSAAQSGEKPLPAKPDAQARPAVGATYAPPAETKASIPDVVPMRRGRPTAAAAPQVAAAAAQKVTKGDPFAALDSKTSRRGDEDEISSKFPSLDQFSLLHDSNSKFDFEDSPITSPPASTATNPKLAEHLADAAFATTPPENTHRSSSAVQPQTAHPPPSGSRGRVPPSEAPAKLPSAPSGSEVSRAQSIISQHPDLKAISSRTASRYVSTGTMTSPHSSSTSLSGMQGSKASNRISVSQMQSPRVPATHTPVETTSMPVRTAAMYNDRSRVSPSPRASLEVSRPPSAAQPGNLNPPKERQPRPVSGSFESSNLDYLRENEIARSSSRTSPNPVWSPPKKSPSLQASSDREPEAFTQTSDLGYLKDLEAREAKEESDRYSYRPSADARPEEKPNLAGKFSSAFKRFETSSPSSAQTTGRTPSPRKEFTRNSQILDNQPQAVNDGTEEEDHSPEKRREIERQQLMEEEARVAKAQAEYRNRTAARNDDSAALPAPRAIRIQDRVNSLLNNEERASPVQRQAEGYGKYSDAATAASKPEKPAPSIPRKPTAMSNTARVDSAPAASGSDHFRQQSLPSATPSVVKASTGRPVAPKKPMHLNNLPTGSRSGSPAKPMKPVRPPVAAEPEEQLIAFDLPGQPALDMSAAEKEDYLEDFSKRYPSLSSMEMVDGARSGGNGGN